MERPELKEKVESLPRVPGVYIYKNDTGNVIYVGKANSLRDRVSSYFQSGIKKGVKTEMLVADISDLEHIEVQSELEALILEAELIKRYRPQYNISLKDDKSYKFIVVKNEKVSGELLPAVTTARDGSKIRGTYFGPYPEGNTVNFVMRTVRKIIPFRDCSEAKYLKYKKLKSPCLYGHLGLCEAPCTGNIDAKTYRIHINHLKKLLAGKSTSILREFRIKMDKLSKLREYERAAYYRDVLQRYEYVTQTFRKPSVYIENPNLVQDLKEEALDELLQNVPILNVRPGRIECYDIANISGKSATASMVVALDGRLAKSEYRKFKIQFNKRPDDFEMMREVLRRRFSRKDKESWPTPQLVVVDGGAGQVSAALEIVGKAGVETAVIGLAKRYEKIIYRKDGRFLEILLDRRSEGLKLLQSLRDEAHRFARRYHHLLRLRQLRSGRS